jgi:hypothetical protein
MADNSQIAQYPFMFDSSQFSNKYSPFAGMSLNPFMGQYNGGSTGPTDAHGNPIQSYQDTQKQHDAWAAANPAQMAAPVTLNSNAGLEAKGSGARAMQDAGYGDWAMLDPTMAQSSIPGQTGGPGSVGYQEANYDKTGPQMMTLGANGLTPAAGSGQAQQTQQNPYDMGQAYLQALQNPGHVATQGATVAQAAPPSNQSGVLQQFLQNWQNQGSPTQGAGNYNNQGFFNSLKGMV